MKNSSFFNKTHDFYPSSQQVLLENVTVRYGSLTALSQIHLAINPGDVLFITGASGAGKSSLLKVIAQDVLPIKGRVRIPSKDYFIAEVFQDLRLLENQTCEENLWMSYDQHVYRNKNEFHRELEELSKVLGAWDYLHHKIAQANGGLKQKVAIIRALLSRPNLLLADEPTAALDKHAAQKVFELLNYYNTRQALTVIWATHNKDLVKQFPGKILHLDKGKIVHSGHACFI